MDGKVWKTIWALKVPPTVRNFIWRACSNILPTKENLHRRRVKVDSRCDICCQQPESNSHLLWECLMAWNVWAISKGRVQKCSNQVHDFFHLFRTLKDKLTKTELERWATTSWAIWNARNKYYFEKVQTQPRTIIYGSCHWTTGGLQQLKTPLEIHHTSLLSHSLKCSGWDCFRIALDCFPYMGLGRYVIGLGLGCTLSQEPTPITLCNTVSSSFAYILIDTSIFYLNKKKKEV